METKVRCIQTYIDSEINERITNNPEDDNYERIVIKERAIELVKAGVCEVIEQEKEQEEQEQQEKEQEEQEEQEKEQEETEKVETAKLEPDTETAVQKSKTSNKKTK